MPAGYSIDIWPAGIVLLVVPLFIVWRRKHNLSYLVCFFAFSIYLVFALDKVFFPLQIEGNYFAVTRQVPFSSLVNLLPFYFGPFGSIESAFLTMLPNVILTIPFGFGLNFVAHTRAKSFLWLAPAIGLGIEIVQLAISLTGLSRPYRLVDVNDVMMNALGVLIGYGIFRAFARFYVWITQRVEIKHRGLAAYIYEVASRSHVDQPQPMR